MTKWKIVAICGTVLLIAAAVVVALRERQSVPLPEVPVAQTPAEVRVKAVERNSAANVATVAFHNKTSVNGGELWYNANTGDTSLYRCEKERKKAVLDGVLYSSSFVCYPGTAPKITEKQKQRLEQDFKRLYEQCKNKWSKKRQFDRRK